MDNFQTNSFASKIQSLLDSEVEFPRKLKQHLVFKSDQVANPFKFISGLLSKGVLCDGTNESEANFGLKEMMVRLAMMISCTKGAEGIGGLMEALEESGNSQLISDFRAWIKQDFGTEIESNFGKPKEDGSVAQAKKSEVPASPTTTANETSSCGAKLIDKIMSRLEDDFMGQLEGHLVSKAAEIVNIPEFRSSLATQQVLDENELQLGSGGEVQDGQQIEKVMKAACLKRAIGSLVVAFQKSNNERILTETYEWLETSQARKKNYPISLKSLGRQPRPTATGLFAATTEGLISLDLRTLEETALTSETAVAVAVNQKLNKVYWTEDLENSRILRSNFDGSAKEIIVPETGDYIFMLAIDEPSGNVYFALVNSNEITVCNAVGQNRAAVISNSSLVNRPICIALDSDNGVMYWGNRGTTPNSLVRANLDGTDATKISTEFRELYGITLDQPSIGVLYWADNGANTIGTIAVNGGNKRTLVKLEGDPEPWGIQVDAHKIYFSNFNGKNIQSVDKGSGKELTTIFNSTGYVRDLALFNAPP